MIHTYANVCIYIYIDTDIYIYAGSDVFRFPSNFMFNSFRGNLGTRNMGWLIQEMTSTGGFSFIILI
jgi:hypothetical protein